MGKKTRLRRLEFQRELRRRASPVTPAVTYTPARYPPSQRFHFAINRRWDVSALHEGIKEITFGRDFDIRNSHLDAIAANANCSSLRKLACGDAYLGICNSLTDSAIINLASQCPHLKHVTLQSATKLTDVALLALINYCPNLQYLELSGRKLSGITEERGKLKGTILGDLRRHPCLGKNLKILCLNGRLHFKASFYGGAERLSIERPELAIRIGNVSEKGHGGVTLLGGVPRTKIGKLFSDDDGSSQVSDCDGIENGGDPRWPAPGDGTESELRDSTEDDWDLGMPEIGEHQYGSDWRIDGIPMEALGSGGDFGFGFF